MTVEIRVPDARRIGDRGDDRALVQEGRRCRSRRRAARRTRNRQGDARSQCAGGRRARPKSPPRTARRSRPARCSARSPKAPAPAKAGEGRGEARRAASRQLRRKRQPSRPPAPAAAKIAAEQRHRCSPRSPGSGKRGQVLKGDVLAFARQPAAPAAPRRPRRRSSARLRPPPMPRAKSACA